MQALEKDLETYNAKFKRIEKILERWERETASLR